MSIDENMEESKQILKSLRNYDSNQFSFQLVLWLRELKHFYNGLVSQQGGKPSESYYKIMPEEKRPNVGQIAYFNLRRGYPKELFDGHWCYVLKDFGTKFLIVPITSVKDNSQADERFEFDIKIKNFINQLPSRMQVSDIRSIDIQRISERHDVYDVETNKEFIRQEILNVISLQDTKEMIQLA